MLKSILQSVLFIALVVLVAYLFVTYAPGLTHRYTPDNGEHALDLEAIEVVEQQLMTYITELETRITGLEKAFADLPPQEAATPADPTPNPETITPTTHSLALLQALNCKMVASLGNSRRLLIELGALEKLLEGLPGDTSTLQRELYLARTETAAGISSAAERLEIIWALLLAH